MGLLYFAAFIDRVNVGFAAAQMNRDLGFSPYVYGLGAGIFFIGYSLFDRVNSTSMPVSFLNAAIRSAGT